MHRELAIFVSAALLIFASALIVAAGRTSAGVIELLYKWQTLLMGLLASAIFRNPSDTIEQRNEYFLMQYYSRFEFSVVDSHGSLARRNRRPRTWPAWMTKNRLQAILSARSVAPRKPPDCRSHSRA